MSKIKVKHIFATAALLVAGTLSSFALAPTKFLAVDMEELYGNYNKAKEAQEKFGAAVQSARDDINAMLQDGLKMGESFQELKAKATNPALTEEARSKYIKEAEAKAQEIQKKEQQINQLRQQSDQSLAQRRESIINLHMSEIKEVVSKLAKDKGADMVLNTSGLMVLYYDKSLDITDEALKVLNADSKSKDAKKTAKK